MTSLKRKSGRAAFPVKTSVSPEWAPVMDLEENSQGFSTILHSLLARVAPKLSSSKTLRHSSLPTMEEISQSSFGRWPSSGMAWRGEYGGATG